MRAPTVFVPAPDAEETIKELAAPALGDAARALVEPIRAEVPVVHGVMLRNYTLTVVDAEPTAEEPEARIYLGSPFWHWLEYGTRWSPPYRVAQTGVERAGVEYVAK